MTATQMKKDTLLRFIRIKMEAADESLAEIKFTMSKLEKMSYKALLVWAIEHDFIDD